MKLLKDVDLPPRVTADLRDVGYGKVHVCDIGLLTATDDEIFGWAAGNGHVVVTADSDFMVVLASGDTRRTYSCCCAMAQTREPS